MRLSKDYNELQEVLDLIQHNATRFTYDNNPTIGEAIGFILSQFKKEGIGEYPMERIEAGMIANTALLQSIRWREDLSTQ